MGNMQVITITNDQRSNWRRKIMIWILIGIAIIAGIILLAIGTITRGTLPLGSWGKVGEPAPDFELTTIDDDVVNLAHLQGQPVVLSFGASWCPYCQREAAFLQTIHERYPHLPIVFVSVEESKDAARAFAQRNGLTFNVLLDTEGDVSRAYGVFRYPSLFFVDAQGIVRAHMNQNLPEEQFVQHLIEIGLVTTP